MFIPSGLRDKADVDEIDFVFDWTAVMAEISDTISTATVTYTGSDTALTVDTLTIAATSVQFWTRAGTSGVSYLITCKVVTVGGRTIERAMRLTIK